MTNAHIVGWGKYLPSKIISNAELAQSAGVDADWIKSRTGIEQRHVADPKQASSDLATQAARAALERADISPSQLSLIIVATSTPDYVFPATACLVQDALGADNAGAFDLGAGCSGFVYALVVADRFIRAGTSSYILVIGVDTTSRVVDWHDKNICPYFGDGAGAVVVTGSEDVGGLLSFSLSADGSGGDLLMLPGGGSRNPTNQESLEHGWQYGRMDGRGLFRYGLRAMTALGRDALRKAHLKAEDIDLFIPHQTNVTLIQQVAERLHVLEGRTFTNVSNYANISSAAIPVSLCDAIQADRIHPGNRLLITVSGAGLTAASLVWQWSLPPPKPMPFVKRFLRALWDGQAAFRSRLFRLEHRIDTLAPSKEEESELPQDHTDRS
jgi:3-oxoacyl-[acyl-carrier-protein] synthase III